jgi:Arc/MetJ-type ribon-helix-helix transcriptional regulator
LRIITVKLPDTYIDGIDELVRLGRYSCRSEAIRVAIRDLLKRELWFSDEELDNVSRSKQYALKVVTDNVRVLKIS